MALSPEQRVALVGAQDAARAEIRRRLVDYALTLWGSLGSWRDADVDYFVDQIVPRLHAGQVAVANITDAYLARILEDEGISVGAIDPNTVRGGVPATEVYRRPAKTLYNELAKGTPFVDAQSAAAARLASLVGTDLQLTHTRQARAVMVDAGARGLGFRRVLTGRENCALCMIASTQRYHRGDLMPIHGGCDCSIEPLRAGENVGQVLDESLLEATHDWVAAVRGAGDRGARFIDGTADYNDYQDLIAVREHGEYGPTLTWRRHSFTGPDDLAA